MLHNLFFSWQKKNVFKTSLSVNFKFYRSVYGFNDLYEFDKRPLVRKNSLNCSRLQKSSSHGSDCPLHIYGVRVKGLYQRVIPRRLTFRALNKSLSVKPSRISLIFAPFSIRNRAQSNSPSLTAASKGEEPSLSRTSSCAPFVTRSCRHSRLPVLAARCKG